MPDAHVEGRKNPPVMNAADMAMIVDPDYLKISKEYRDNPDVLVDEFARAWYKLLHRDMGPSARYLGPQVPNEVLVWQDPVPKHEGPLVSDEQIATLKQAIADPELTAKQLVETAWASACTYRQTDHRGGANGARIRLEPQTANRLGYQRARRRGGCDRPVGEDKSASEANISLADVIVLGGGVGVEMAAKAAGHELTVPFTPGRTDTSQEMTEVDAHAYLEPRHDAFRNYMQEQSMPIPAEHLMIDRAFMLNLSAPPDGRAPGWHAGYRYQCW
ncbi:peroxidase family protein [Vreelandella populi]|uniref:peroxidase family protein n=1 Tax=Vreelandella populi TaxID=2498858 RepID=UPI0021AF6AF7|nr:peroxidase family protein [Halomonas populi]